MDMSCESLFTLTPPAAPRRKQRPAKRHLSMENQENQDPDINRKLTFSPEVKAEEPLVVSSADSEQQEQQKCTFHQLTRDGGSVQFWRSLSGLQDCGWTVPATQRRSAFWKLLKAAVCVILEKCASHLNKKNCLGCIFEMGGQLSHSCLSEDVQHFDQLLKDACHNLKIVPLLNTCLYVGASLGCFCLNQNNIISIGKMIQKISNAWSPIAELKKVRELCPQQYISIAEKYLAQSGLENVLDTFL
ncbi:uncharacterized protein LOC125425573 [Sphaerodactylus townsendi]|uniref:uncharacterized protein LOC125425573 n=1 Tax=Sphaerodactylus townsendi TaxID=933632 RepID=UPI0020274D76|nr:uncharacterized protein LOC125425573 [Sphaerodactylus townsendi]